MSEQKMVKVKLLKSVNAWKAGDIIEVPEEQAKQMTTTREIHNGSHLEHYQTAEMADESSDLKNSLHISQMTVKDMADIGMKNVVSAPKSLATSSEGLAQPQLSTTTNESIPHATGAPMASIAISDLDEEDMSSDDESLGYDGANPLAHSREGGKLGKAAKASKAGNAPAVGSMNVPSEGSESHSGGVASKVKEAAKEAVHKVTGK